MKKFVYVDGPESSFNYDGDEVPEWTVFIGDEDGEAHGTVYRCHTLSGAKSLGEKIARDRRLELVDDSNPA